jgi:hypothetical protein
MIKATKNSEAGVMPEDESLFVEMGRFNEELVKAGVMMAGDGLKPSREGKRVKLSGGQRLVTDGPFAETKELVAGYWVWKVNSMAEAIQWIMRCPHPMPGEDSEIEIRPLYDMEDFAELYPQELRDKEQRMREEIERKHGG